MNKNSYNTNQYKSAMTLIVLRVIIITIFLGAIILFQGKMDKNYPIIPLIYVIISTYVLTILYSLSLKFVKNIYTVCYAQIVIDLVIEAFVIAITGATESIFTFFYILSIISASINLIKPANYIIAGLSGILYTITAYLELSHATSPILSQFYIQPYNEGYILYKIFFNITAFFMVAYLSGYLGDKWRAVGRELEEKNENLIELKTFHENIVKSMSSGLITTDLDGKITSFNKAGEDITGLKWTDVSGVFLLDFMSFLDKERLLDYIIKGEKYIFRAEGYFERKDHKKIYIGISISSLRDDKDHIKGLIGTFQDLTNMKEMEEKVARAERFAAIGRISAGIAHEIRNPLASMSGSIQVLRDELTLDGANKQLMDIVIKETDRLNSIITQFLTYASPRPSDLKATNINEVIRETITLLKNIKDYNSTIKIEEDFKEEVIAGIDTAQIKQVIINLCLNSFQAITGEDGRLTISSSYYYIMGAGKKKDRYAKIIFKDTGCGIPKNVMDKIFDPFYTTKDMGSGLGLAIVYRIIEKHNGFIDIESEEGKGTSVSVYLPA